MNERVRREFADDGSRGRSMAAEFAADVTVASGDKDFHAGPAQVGSRGAEGIRSRAGRECA
jgi:hypothetical protein